MATTQMSQQDKMKMQCAQQAVDRYVRSGMVLGLGTGSTAAFMVKYLGQLIMEGKLTDIIGIPTSEATRILAESLCIPLTTLENAPNGKIDVAIDGADEVSADLQLVKGRGGALLREKMVERAADKFVCIVDDTKLQPGGLGLSGAMPVEIVQFCSGYTIRRLKELTGADEVIIRPKRKDSPNDYLVTDNGNYIADLYYRTQPIADPRTLAASLEQCGYGVVDHGLFLDMADCCIIASVEDGVYTWEKGQDNKKGISSQKSQL